MPSSIDLLTALALLALATLAVVTPDPHSPSIVPLALVAGGLLGTAVARLRRVDRPRMREITENYAFAAGLLAAFWYLFTLVTGV